MLLIPTRRVITASEDKPPGSPGGFFVSRPPLPGCPCPMPLPPAPTKRAALLPAGGLRRPGPVLAQGGAKIGGTRRPSRRSLRSRRRPTTSTPAPRSAGDAAPGRVPRRGADRGAAAAAPAGAAAAVAGRRSGAAQEAQAHRARQAVRARHQRADARPDVPVPLRGARHLPADDRAGGTRRPQEGHDRGRAQRPPGQPLARRAGRRPGRGHRRRPEARHHRPPRSRRQPVLPDPGAGQPPAAQPAAGQGRQPDPGRRAGPARAVRAARGGAGVQGHQHARQGARAGPGDRRLPERQDAGRPRPDVLRRAGAAGRLLGQARQDRGELAERPAHLLPDHRPDRAQPADQPVRVLRGARRAQPVCARDRDPRQDRGAARR